MSDLADLSLTHRTAGLITRLVALRRAALDHEASHDEILTALPAPTRDSARNLLHYLALRQHDIRDLQVDLSRLGLSRLGRSEAHTMGSIDAILDALHALVAARRPPREAACAVGIGAGGALLGRHAERLLGPPPAGHDTRIMVTAPSEAAHDTTLLANLLDAGMRILRINCAHDTPDDWLAMIARLREAQRQTGHECRVYADLAGPKLRTGDIAAVGRLAEFKPRRDAWGRVTAPAAVWLTPADAPEAPPRPVDAVLPVDAALLAQARPGDVLEVADTREITRRLRLDMREGDSWLALARRHGYVTSGAACHLRRNDVCIADSTIGEVHELVLPIELRAGDPLTLVRPDGPGALAEYDLVGQVVTPARIPCTLPAVFDAARVGEAIWFDDGKIGGVITATTPDTLTIEVVHAEPRGSKLRAGKGINLPDTGLATPALTDDDMHHLALLAPHVDIIGLSFVRRADDLRVLHTRLAELDAGQVGVVAKIETRQGFQNLPDILLAGLARPPFGIMVARGDLAVEVGFERLSEVQEEIVWLCEAAHVPVIWATQVLESMTRRGLPSRAEVSDAALAARAECVMLNKGPYIVDTTRFLSGVLTRMGGHAAKRAPMLRRLAVSGGGVAD